VLGACAAGKATGHGRGLSLDRPNTMIGKSERLEFLLRPVYYILPVYWYKCAILAITGLASVLAFSVALLFVNPLWGAVSAIGGLFKWLGYGVSLKLGVKHYTVIGEYVSGALAYVVLDVILVMEFLL